MSERHLIHSSEKFRVERLTQRVADGTTRGRDIVVHSGAAVILPLLPDGRIVMVRNTRVTVDRELLELPAGTLDPDESPAACAGRELAEETGYTAGRLSPLLSFYATPGFCTERMHVFVATDLRPGTQDLDEGESIRVESRTREEALRAIQSGEICDAKTIVALLFYERFGVTEGGGR